MSSATGKEVRSVFFVKGGSNVGKTAMLIVNEFGGIDAWPAVHNGPIGQARVDLDNGKLNFVWSEAASLPNAVSLVVDDLDTAIQQAIIVAGTHDVAAVEMPCPIQGMRFLKLEEEDWVFSFHLSTKQMEQLNPTAELAAAA